MQPQYVGPLPPPPFANEAGESQELWLGPPQDAEDMTGSYRLFYEPGGAANSRQLAHKTGANVPGPTPIDFENRTRADARRVPNAPAIGTDTDPARPVHLEYHLMMRLPPHPSGNASGNHSGATPDKYGRKMERTPASLDVDQQFSRLKINSQPTGQSPDSPARKRPSSQSSSAINEHSARSTPAGMISPLNFWRPLSAEGRALTMEQFLTHCLFAPDDAVPRGLVALNHIRHWSFFRKSNPEELKSMGFPLAIARLILNGTEELEYTHVLGR